MIRQIAIAAAIVVSQAMIGAARAQDTPYDDPGFESGSHPVVSATTVPNGGFGVQYSQPVTAGSWIVDQYGMVQMIPSVERAPRAAVQQPAPAAQTPRSAANRAKAKPRYQLPTGSLVWAGADGVVNYSPAMRHESYGSGYGRGPYGVVNYGYMYKGWELGY